MASTNKTEHLGLCQWVKTDHFLMDDMNDTLEKIDSAIGGMSRVKLFDVTVTEAVSLIQFNFTDIDLSLFAELEIFSDFKQGAANMRVNSKTGNVYKASDISGGYNNIVLYSGESHISITSTNFIHRQDDTNRIYRMSRSDFPTLITLNIYTADGSLSVGDRVSVWGVKR